MLSRCEGGHLQQNYMVASDGCVHTRDEGFHIRRQDTAAWRTVLIFSKYSFTVYLVHMPIIELTEYFSEHVMYLGYAPFLAIVLSATVVMTALLHHLVEVPFAKLIKRRRTCQK